MAAMARKPGSISRQASRAAVFFISHSTSALAWASAMADRRGIESTLRAADFPDPQTLRDTAEAGMADDGVADLPDHLRADLCDGLHALARALDRALAAALPASDQLRGTLPRTAANKSGTKSGTKAA